eukprot:gnl/MRDRNA2_/MRDRNA2_78635_c0_seq1.p1 gnl/MRDRNA2_/MRDRNA2_78635_c0~~gnl/MRDRNA2_/MRDRNA2_78635_c0_seq1.p1  ORF type:complete len:140 (+),score=19.05 gnl/MRDRNA2_/MRDRNA2_78635_c0_seq1:96-515(+)
MFSRIVAFALLASVSALTAPKKQAKLAKQMPHVEIERLSPGDGATHPQSGDKLTVHYTGTLLDGTQFDSSRDGEPLTFTHDVGQVIQGWDQALSELTLGERAKLTIPAELAYGARGAGSSIPPNSDLIFDVEVMKIDKA